MTLLEDMLKQVDQAESELIELERALVQIPSVNTGFMPTGNETPVCQYISDYLSKDDIDSQILEAAPQSWQYSKYASRPFRKYWSYIHVTY